MDIISFTKNDGVLVELSNLEFVNLTGHTTTNYAGRCYNLLGTTLDLNPAIAKMAELPGQLNKITQAQIELRRAADIIEPLKPLIAEITKTKK